VVILGTAAIISNRIRKGRRNEEIIDSVDEAEAQEEMSNSTEVSNIVEDIVAERIEKEPDTADEEKPKRSGRSGKRFL